MEPTNPITDHLSALYPLSEATVTDLDSIIKHKGVARDELLEKKYSGITNRCPLRYIASYIGTSPVSVSRIRAGLQ